MSAHICQVIICAAYCTSITPIKTKKTTAGKTKTKNTVYDEVGRW